MVNEDSGKVGSRCLMLRAERPAEGDDSKETNTAVVHPVTDASREGNGRLIMILGIWRQG